jgi:hypothetical protein
MDYRDALTAMTIADLAGPEHTHEELRTWIKREIWADGLGLTAVDVLDHLECSPAWAAGERRYYEHDCEYFPKKRQQSRRKSC